MNLDSHTASVEVQFSGNARTYHYLTDSVEWCAINKSLEEQREIRVVTPGKVKDDRLSVSVATVVSCQPVAHPEAVLPIVAVVSSYNLSLAKWAVTEHERIAAAAKASSEAGASA